MENEKTDRQMLEEILEQTRKTKNYMKWQLIITVALVVIPLIGTIALIPYALKSFTSIYSTAGLGTGDDTGSSNIQDIIHQYTK